MNVHARFFYLAILILVLLVSCSNDTGDEENHLFEPLSPSQTGIDFENNLFPTEEFNMYAFRSFYNGGGVAVGDMNNDGLPDIFFTGNMVSNRLYLNRGDFEFEDVTEEAGLLSDGVWSAGVSFADVTGDGLLDIYITKSGRPSYAEASEGRPAPRSLGVGGAVGERRHNELFINMGVPENGDTDVPVFEEWSAEYGLDVTGLSTQAHFFDYDRDGDLDLYLLNTSFDSIGGYENITGEARQIRDPKGGDKLFRNDTPLASSLEGESKGEFTDVTTEAGIYSSRIAFGLSASVADVNRDGWPDIYVANDFFERDYLYINNRDGTFREVLDEQMNSISLSSMGSDIADLNRDGWPDVYVADMYPHSENRKKTKMRYETYSEYRANVENGFHHQVTRNTLQLNLGNDLENNDMPLFSEIGRLSGVEASDWSWAVLLADYDHNGHTDIYVTNGIYKDLLDQDFIHYMADPNEIRGMIQADRDDVIMTLMERIPSEPQPNFLFSGEGGLRFANRSEAWGLARPGFSSGAAWGDLNGDGALDLVVSNVNGAARVYRNRAVEVYPERGRLFVELQGEAPNTQAIGAQLEVWTGEDYWYREHMLQRGFQSSVAPGLHIGLGDGVSRIDSLRLRWPDGRITRMQNIDLPARLSLKQSQSDEPEPITPPPPFMSGDLTIENLRESSSRSSQSSSQDLDSLSQRMGHNLQSPQSYAVTANRPLLEDITGKAGISWTQNENDYNDFNRERLLVHMRSTEGPAMCTEDVTGDGLEDMFIGGARGQVGTLLIQDGEDRFTARTPQIFKADKASEDTDCVMFDANGDGHTDLYVTSGGNSFSSGSSALADRLYLGDGQAGFTRSEQVLPTRQGFVTTSAVAVGDMTGNGAPDLFVGERLRLFSVGVPGRGFLLENDGQGNFTEVTSEWAPELGEAGMITDAVWTDWDGDGRQDLVMVGEWMSPRIFINTGNRMEEITGELGLPGLTGWWNAVHAADLNGDGRPDLVLGNHGLNSQFRATKEHPVHMWVGDFDGNGMIDQILSMPSDGKDYPVALRHELLEQVPSLGEDYPDYASYGGQTVQDILSDEQREKALILEAAELASVVVWNEPEGVRIERLPLRAQLSPVYGIWSGDLTCDGNPEILTAGNLAEVKPVVGPYDASHGAVITLNGQGRLSTLSQVHSGFKVNGASRAIRSLQGANGDQLMIVARNDQSPKVFQVGCTGGLAR